MTNNYTLNKEKVTQITIRNVSPELHGRIKQDAEKNKRSMNNELLDILERYFLKLDEAEVVLYDLDLE